MDMIIGVGGPYTAPTEEQKQKNLDAMNEAAARLLEMGHIPIIGVNAALPIVQKADVEDKYKAIMDISMAVIDKCEAILMIGESAGANREKEHVAAKGLPVYWSIDEVPLYNEPTKEFIHYVAQYFTNVLDMQDVVVLKKGVSEVRGGQVSNSLKNLLIKHGWIKSDADPTTFLSGGYEQFKKNIALRILREYPEKVIYNNCPKCGKLTRTPYAKQCQHCYHGWH